MKTWLFKPFERVAGGRALAVGLIVLMLTAVLAWQAGLHTDGVIDLHFGPSVGLWVLVLQGLINWLLLSAALLGVGKWLSNGRFRLLDLFATQAMARWPLLIGVVWLSIPGVGAAIESRTASLMAQIPEQPGQVIAPMEYMLDAMWLLLMSLPVMAAIVWMIWLMFHGYALVTNLRGMRAFFSFVGALVAAEIISKVLIHLLLQAAL